MKQARVVLGIGSASSASVGVGKSTMARAIKYSLGYHLLTAEIVSFAGQLKLAVAMKFGIPMQDLESQEGKRKVCPLTGLTYRQILQREGTELARDIYRQDFWAARLEHGQFWRWDPETGAILDVTSKIREADVLLIDDVRFDDEATFVVDQRHGRLLLLSGGSRADMTQGELAHASEAGLQQGITDLVYDNSGGIDLLEKEAVRIAAILASLAQEP